MNKKGFTLVEMIATILVITILTLLVVPNILNSVNNKRKDISSTAKQMIYDATDMYVKDNSESYPIENDAVYCIKLETLVNSGRLSKPVKDLKNDREIPLNYYVKTTIDEYGQYSYVLVDNKSCTPALAYTIENQNKDTGEKTITIKYPSSNYVKKYKITSGTTKEDITLNTEVAVSENPTITFTSNGSITFWLEDNGDKLSETTANINKIDTTLPILTLSKITYKNIPFDSSWTLDGASVDSDGVLTITSAKYPVATSGYIDVNGGFWYMTFDGYSDNQCQQYSPNAGITWSSYYFDNNYATTYVTINNNQYSNNGFAVALAKGAWKNDILWQNSIQGFRAQNRYGTNVKYIVLKFNSTGAYSSTPPVKVRNLKIYGEEMPNSFYLINVSASDTESKIKDIKYAKGDKDSRYFENAGTKVENNQIRVTSNGVYSVCVTDNAGNMKIEKITIDQIN